MDSFLAQNWKRVNFLEEKIIKEILKDVQTTGGFVSSADFSHSDLSHDFHRLFPSAKFSVNKNINLQL